MTVYSAAIILILIMDPFGNIPLFLSILKGIPPKRQAIIMLRETFIAFIVLCLFLFFGKYIMSGLHLTEAALGIAGGIILFLIAIRMIFPSENGLLDPTELKHEPLIVPLAIPLISGPSAMAMVLLFATKEPHRLGEWFLAILIASVVFGAIISAASFFTRILGNRGLQALERLMGMILTTMAVQMFLTGLQSFFK